jgi:hypothetical protein
MRMFTSLVLVALSSCLAHEALVPERPTWLSDYAVASNRGIAQRKPLAVFIGTGKAGWEGISKDGELGTEAKELLETHYVCVYLDTSKRAGRELAEAFAVSDSVGLVLSDRTGKLQAFKHEGELASSELQRYLRRYADPDRVVTTTETKEQLEYRAPPPVRAPVYYAPVRSFGGRSC